MSTLRALNLPFITYLIYFRTLTNDDSSIYDYAQLVLGFFSVSSRVLFILLPPIANIEFQAPPGLPGDCLVEAGVPEGVY